MGDLTTNDRSEPAQVAGLSGVTQLALGGQHSCALRNTGLVVCWGANDFGQLGDGSTSDRMAPVPVSGLNDARFVATRAEHACAVQAAGTVVCWGRNFHGQLGDDSTTDRNSPVTVQSVSNASQVATGGEHSCALLTNGEVNCWGNPVSGQLGNGEGCCNIRTTPQQVTGLTGAVAISSGRAHTCTRLDDGSVECWGRNADGHLGDGTRNDRHTPVQVSMLGESVDVIGLGFDHTCAILSDGALRCWGYNGEGRLGDGTDASRTTPVDVWAIGVGESSP